MNIGRTTLTPLQFQGLWLSIQNELLNLYKGYKCKSVLVYDNIYIICTSITQKYVEELYWKIGDFLYERLREMRPSIFKKDWIYNYTIYFDKFKQFVDTINDLLFYLNQFISTKSIHNFAFLLWERCILQNVKSNTSYENMTDALLHYDNFEINDIELPIDNIPDGYLNKNYCTFTDTNIIYNKAINTFKYIIVDTKYPLLYYTERYENYYLNSIKEKYEEFTKNNNLNIIDYIKQAYKFIQENRYLRQFKLLPESYTKLELILEDILIIQRRKFIKTELFKILFQHKIPSEVLNVIMNSNSNTNTKVNLEVQINSDNISEVSPQNFSLSTGFKDSFADYTEINDFYALYDIVNPKLYTFSSEILHLVNDLSIKLITVPYGYKIIKDVLIKYLDTELQTHKHLLNRRIESLYIFFIVFKKVVEIGFNNLLIDSLNLKLKEVYNNLKPNLIKRLIEFSNSIFDDNDIKRENLKNRDFQIFKLDEQKKEKIDFYKNNEYNFNEEYFNEEINLISENEEEVKIENTNVKKEVDNNLNNVDILNKKSMTENNKILHNYDDATILKTTSYKQKNKSLPDLTKHLDEQTYKEKAQKRVFIVLYDLIDDKTEFIKNYLSELTKRLLIKNSNLNKEYEIFKIFNNPDCKEIIKNGEIMFRDLKNSINKSTKILTSNAWPINSNINIKMPIELNQYIKDPVLKYNWEYSTIEISFGENLFLLNLLQFCVLVAINGGYYNNEINNKACNNLDVNNNIKLDSDYYNNKSTLSSLKFDCNNFDSNNQNYCKNGFNIDRCFNKKSIDVNNQKINYCITKQHLIEKTGLFGKELEFVLNSLIRSQLIIQETKNKIRCDETTYKLNKNLPNLYYIVDYYIKEEIEEYHEINLELYYQGHISRIMKKYKEVTFENLCNIIKQEENKIVIDEEGIIKGIRMCEEKGIIEKIGNEYIYIP